MKKVLVNKILLIFVIIGSIVYIFNIFSVFATDGISIATVSSEKVSPGEDFYLIINLSAINYNKFQIDITNNQNLVSTELTGTVQELSSNNLVTTFTIDKNQISLDKLGIIYKASEVEGQITFNIKVTSPLAFTTTEFLKLPDKVYVPASVIVRLLSYSLKLISLEFTVWPASTSDADVSFVLFSSLNPPGIPISGGASPSGLSIICILSPPGIWLVLSFS